MKKIENISLIGLGGVGCAYASRLYDMDPGCIRVIAGEERATRYKKKGFVINGKPYNFTYIAPKEKCSPADLIIVAVKTYNLNAAIEDIKNHVGKDTIILSLLNGIDSEEIIGQRYGMDKMLYSYCIGIDASHNDNIMSFSKKGKLAFGERINKAYSPKVEAVKHLFDNAVIPYIIPEDMIRSLWWKFMVNAGINPVSAVLRATYDVFWTNEEAREVMEAAMLEVIELSKVIGVNLNQEDIAKWYDVLNNLAPKGITSMLEDITRGTRTEIDAFSGTVIKLGQKYGVETPINKIMYNLVKVMEHGGREV